MSTARDRIEAQRQGFLAGSRATTPGRWTAAKRAAAERLAAEAFPIPTFERVRIVRTRHREFKIDGGVLLARYIGPLPAHYQHHMSWKPYGMVPSELAAVLELFERPTETVQVV